MWSFWTFLKVQEILEGAKVLEWLREHAEIQYITRWEMSTGQNKPGKWNCRFIWKIFVSADVSYEKKTILGWILKKDY